MSMAQETVVAAQVEKQRLGYQAISLTNFALTTEPQIASGSKIEIGDALFYAGANLSGTGWGGIAVSSQVYFKLTVTGSAADWSYTTTAPTWDTAKQGWYSGADRYFGGLYKDSGGNYTKKWLYRASSGGVQNVREYGDGTIEIIGATTITGTLAASGALTVPSLTLNGVPLALGITQKTQAIGPGGAYVLPRGFHQGFYAVSSTYSIEFFVSGAWRANPVAYSHFVSVFSDGTNVRLHDSGSGVTVYWQEMS